MIVTDVKWKDKGGVLRQGYSMDGTLVENLAPIPQFLAKDRDIVGIVSGRGMTRNGKSTHGIGIGYFIAWSIAGGLMDIRRGEDNKFINPIVIKKPTKSVNFSLENFCYTPDDLIKKAEDLYKKYGKEQVILYDECSGLDSKGTMKAINQKLEHFFQTCGAYNHVILIILPNFFKLNEDIATTRSMFLVDCYSDDNWARGFFDYFGPKAKEWLYFLGKKKIGVGNKYFSQKPSFYGRFGDWLPFDREEYEEKKQEALKKKVFGSREERTREKYWGVLTFLKTNTNLTTKEIAEGVSKLLFREITPVALENDLRNYLRYAEKHQKEGGVS